MKKIFIGCISFVLGVYIALSTASVLAFTNPSENPPGGNITPTFSGVNIDDGILDIDDGRFTVDNDGFITTIGGSAIQFQFDKQVKFNDNVSIADGKHLYVSDKGVSALEDDGEIHFRSPVEFWDTLDVSTIFYSGEAHDGDVYINDGIEVEGGTILRGNALLEGDTTFDGSAHFDVAAENVLIEGSDDADPDDANSGILRVKWHNNDKQLILDNNEIMSYGGDLYINRDNDRNVFIGKSTNQSVVDIQGHLDLSGNLNMGGQLALDTSDTTIIRSNQKVNSVGGTNINRGILNIKEDDDTHAIAIDGRNIVSEGGPLKLNATDASEDVWIGALNDDTDLILKRGALRFGDDAHIYAGNGDDIILHGNLKLDSGDTIGRFYERHSANVSVAGGANLTATASCDAGDMRVSCSWSTQQSVWVVPNGAWPDPDQSRTCIARMTNRSAGIAKTFRARAYCFSPNG